MISICDGNLEFKIVFYYVKFVCFEFDVLIVF